MKRGFTLIELLAVIVILAIIALIATPIILNIIDETKESASLRSVEFYLDAVENSILIAELNSRRITDGKYNVLETGNICLEYDSEDKCIDELVIEVKGEKPNSGTITITKGKIEDISLNLNDKEIVFGENGSLEIKKPEQEEEPDIDDISICKLISGEEKEIGSKYECEVKPGTKYNFYVLSKEEDKLNLIMERNICEDGTVATEENTCTVAWYSVSRDRSYGPVTAMTYLHNTTKDWINIPNIIMDYEDENINPSTQEKGTTGYGSIKTENNTTTIADKNGNITAMYTNLKARLPKYSEVHGNGKCLTYAKNGDNYGSCPLWLVDYLNDNEYSNPYYNSTNGKTNLQGIYGYWILSSQDDDCSYAWHVYYDGHVSVNDVDFGYDFGVRPVITVLQSSVSK